MAVTLLRQSLDMDGVTVLGGIWSDGSAEMALPPGTTQAAADAAFGIYATAAAQEALAAAPPKAPDIRIAEDGTILIMDQSGKPLVSFKRGADGAVDLKAHDDSGNITALGKGQMVTLSFSNAKTATAKWPVPFRRTPSVNLTLLGPNAQPAYKADASKTSVTVKFANAFTGLVEVLGVER